MLFTTCGSVFCLQLEELEIEPPILWLVEDFLPYFVSRRIKTNDIFQITTQAAHYMFTPDSNKLNSSLPSWHAVLISVFLRASLSPNFFLSTDCFCFTFLASSLSLLISHPHIFSVLSIRLSSTASGSDSLFGPPLESTFKSKSFDGREQIRQRSTFGASECMMGFYFKMFNIEICIWETLLYYTTSKS